jgi:hypothetical protein
MIKATLAGICALTVLGGTVGPGGTVEAAHAAALTFSFAESFESGPVGSKPTAANTAYDETIGSRGDGDGSIAVVFDANGYWRHCVRFYNTRISGGAFGFLGKQVGQKKVLYLRRYYKLDTWPQYRTSVLLYKYGGGGNGQLGGTHNGSFAFGGAGQGHHFTLVDNNTNKTQSRARVPLNSWFRVEVKLDFTSGHGVQTVRLFLGSNVNGRTPSETISGPLTGPYADYIEDGILTNPNTRVNIRIDGARNANGWIGPA